MEKTSSIKDFFYQRTKTAFWWDKILKAPFWSIFNMLPFILTKDLHATRMQIALYTSLKPSVGILSLYWSSATLKKQKYLVSSLIQASIFGLLPFFATPYFSSPWYFLLAFSIFMIPHRGIIPAWMEIIKLNLRLSSTGTKIFAAGSTFSHISDSILILFIGYILDHYHQAWRWIFPLFALLSLCSIFFLKRIPTPLPSDEEPYDDPSSSQFTQPWKEAWNLLLKRPDFRNFQIGFALGGAALMLMSVVLPIYFMEELKLSYTEVATAIMFCKGISYTLASPLWARFLNRVNIFYFGRWLSLFGLFFPLCLLFAPQASSLLFIAYISYGIMQAGSDLSWNLSGPIFAKDENSTPFSSLNIVSVGLRGLIIPPIGAIIGFWLGSQAALILGGVLWLICFFHFSFYSKVFQDAKLSPATT